MRFIGGATQQLYVEKTRGLDPSRCLAAGVDVGKREGLALVADHRGELVGPPIAFALTEPGVCELEASLDAAVGARRALSLRVGVESAGHYHRAVMSRLAARLDIVELNPAQVKAAREAQGAAKIKTDLQDCAAIVDLVISGMGRAPQQRDDAMVEQLVWAGLRARRVKARTAVSNQLLGTLDLVFPGLDDCFDTLLKTRIGGVLIHHLIDPDLIVGLGVDGLRAFAAGHGVTLQATKARRLQQAAAVALRLPAAERACRAAVLAADVAQLDALNRDIALAEQHLGAVLADTPASVLTSLPGIAVVRASNYGAALGDPSRFGNAEQAYRLAGMIPTTHASAGSTRGGQRLSRRGSPELRAAIVELGKGLSQRDPHFAAYKRGLRARNMPALKANIAVGHRAHRLAFALMRAGQPYDSDRYATSIRQGGERRAPRTGGPVKKFHREAACRHDVTHPPTDTVPRHSHTRKTLLVT